MRTTTNCQHTVSTTVYIQSVQLSTYNQYNCLHTMSTTVYIQSVQQSTDNQYSCQHINQYNCQHTISTTVNTQSIKQSTHNQYSCQYYDLKKPVHMWLATSSSLPALDWVRVKPCVTVSLSVGHDEYQTTSKQTVTVSNQSIILTVVSSLLLTKRPFSSVHVSTNVRLFSS